MTLEREQLAEYFFKLQGLSAFFHWPVSLSGDLLFLICILPLRTPASSVPGALDFL